VSLAAAACGATTDLQEPLESQAVSNRVAEFQTFGNRVVEEVAKFARTETRDHTPSSARKFRADAALHFDRIGVTRQPDGT
jgi:hypothetical protein